MPPKLRYYLWQLAISMLLYVILVLASILLVNALHPVPALRTALALLPLAAVIWEVLALRGFLGAVDELALRMHLQAFAVAVLVTSLLSVGYGLLQLIAHYPPVNAIWAFLSLDAIWALSLPFVARRYR